MMRLRHISRLRALRLALAVMLAVPLGLPGQVSVAAGQSLPPLREVSEIDNGLLWVALADEIRKSCDGIEARMFNALMFLNSLKRTARDMGYSREQVRTYLKSDDEKARMRERGEAYLAAQGVSPEDEAGLCKLGRAEIDRNSRIGTLLKAK
ncbi:DUF5333 domain-containing protein [Sediminimonas qiaohouensis]|uniref:DUF5333 domain-containing protein n=1 Tax=Sediminimonas qiaohouensis TaxID=552061 RepID=UPI0003FDC8F9|nr:DUF5333 domain-containing protein [Sediminimonas qiaohouensis]